MTMIVAGNFSDRAQADSAIQALMSQGVAAQRINSFLTGSEESSPATPKEVEVTGGALKGAAIGGAIGLGAGVIAGPAGMVGGAAVGAYVGSLAGAFSGMSEEAAEAPETPVPHSETTTPGWHPNQVNVAVDTPIAADRVFVAGILRSGGATDVTEIQRI